MVYLSKEILFIILVAVLFVGGSSNLTYNDSDSAAGVEGFDDVDEDDTYIQTKPHGGCKPGCTRATAMSGNCKWLPRDAPRHKQRYICPHTCDRTKTGSKCSNARDCTACTPQGDFTASTYSKTVVKKGTGATCAINKPCTFNSKARVLKVCNPHDKGNGANNLICVNPSKTYDSSEAKWVDIDTAVSLLPEYTPFQSALITCIIDGPCSTEGERCTDANGKRIICNNNLWLADRSSGGGDDTDDDDDDDGDSNGGKGYKGYKGYRGGKGGKGSKGYKGGKGGKGKSRSDIVDNYYTVNHFYGAGTTKTSSSPAATTTTTATTATTAATVPAASPSHNYGVSAGSTTVPLLVPKGEVAVVRAYEASIRF